MSANESSVRNSVEDRRQTTAPGDATREPGESPDPAVPRDIDGLSWKTLRELEERYGDSFYLLSPSTFRQNFTEFQDAFRGIYPQTTIAYSYKTNYTPLLCKAVDEMGGFAEVVSQMEYDLALKVGVAPGRIIFNGPYKNGAELANALLRGSIVNLDSAYEVETVKAIAAKEPSRTLKVGLRCNFDIGEAAVSRFGFDVDGEGFARCFAELAALPNCRVAGLHCHFSTGARSTASFGRRVGAMLDLTRHYFRGGVPDFLNLGGGFFSKMGADLRKQFDCHVPTYAEYARAIATPVARAYGGAGGPLLILEPGASITANVMKFVAKVMDIKTVRSRTMALVSGSFHNIKPTKNRKNLPAEVVQRAGGGGAAAPRRRAAGPVDLVGYTCMEDDTLFGEFDRPLAPGDYVVFDNVGAYTNVMKPPFIRPSPPILGFDAGSGKFFVVKRSEQLSDVFATYTF